MPYSQLTPALIDENNSVSEKKKNNKTKKVTKFSDIFKTKTQLNDSNNTNNLKQFSDFNESDDEDNNFTELKNTHNQKVNSNLNDSTNKPNLNNLANNNNFNENNFNQHNFRSEPDSKDENINFDEVYNNSTTMSDNYYKSSYGNYDNNFMIDESEFNKHLSSNNNNLPNNLNSDNTYNNLNNKELLTKLNYIVHLLEEQRSEKTNYITEELILYLFLGVFIIFVLDSFSKSAKYVR